MELECALTPGCPAATEGERPENPAYLSEQLITYLGNKRTLLGFIGEGLDLVRARLGKRKLDSFDAFSGSGIVSRYLKRYSRTLYANDLERYAGTINRCYLTNREDFPEREFLECFREIEWALENRPLEGGLIAELYAPKDDGAIGKGERAFYTTRNARYIDTARALIDGVPEGLRDFFLAPLLSEASIHANTAGVFKGFYKNPETGIGQFGGKNGDALSRIRGDIALRRPVLSDHSCECRVLTRDANEACALLPEVDVAYLDPPYNQHPYGSNYFMLNAILDNARARALSPVSGIPPDWNRSRYNKRERAGAALAELVAGIDAKFLLVSFNSEGFIARDEMEAILGMHGPITVLETGYNAFRGSRNLRARGLHVREYLFLLEKNK
ncbi:MAG TPA: DNA adenine methylase [Treponemataceae bacterium]|nr:DNA adenine methylase [Treponemataceae bacterium]